ncbi:hypothetical protein R3P38DRAFT_3380868 [Favolaschia claudopus]|uniref:Uncharacterized protein n=1 Tax=Favolaschia claudopus TaxID=2862362 RepID=A0AAV9Z0H7_9AGAR
MGGKLRDILSHDYEQAYRDAVRRSMPALTGVSLLAILAAAPESRRPPSPHLPRLFLAFSKFSPTANIDTHLPPCTDDNPFVSFAAPISTFRSPPSMTLSRTKKVEPMSSTQSQCYHFSIWTPIGRYRERECPKQRSRRMGSSDSAAQGGWGGCALVTCRKGERWMRTGRKRMLECLAEETAAHFLAPGLIGMKDSEGRGGDVGGLWEGARGAELAGGIRGVELGDLGFVDIFSRRTY